MKMYECEGACGDHVGPVRKVYVGNWGWFCYCEQAIADDRRAGLVIYTDQEENKDD